LAFTRRTISLSERKIRLSIYLLWINDIKS
jgi:hypothetical protein